MSQEGNFPEHLSFIKNVSYNIKRAGKHAAAMAIDSSVVKKNLYHWEKTHARVITLFM